MNWVFCSNRALALQPGLTTEAKVREQVLAYADGDARRLFNFIEQLFNAAQSADKQHIDEAFLESTLASKLRRFDKGGEEFYDQISALHKSVRGSNPDAALYWLMRMLDGGADPLYLGRRIVRMAIEDMVWLTRGRRHWHWKAARSTSGWGRRKANWRWRTR